MTTATATVTEILSYRNKIVTAIGGINALAIAERDCNIFGKQQRPPYNEATRTMSVTN